MTAAGAISSVAAGISATGMARRAWWAPDAVLDADYSQGRFFYQGSRFGSAAAWQAAVGGTAAGGVTVLGPVVTGAELLTNGDFSNGTTGWTGQTGGTIGVEAGELTLTGNGGNTPAATHPVTVAVGRAYQLRGKVRRGAVGTVNAVAGVSSAASLAGNHNFSGGPTISTGSFAEWLGTFSMFQTTAYVGMRAFNNPANGTVVMDDFSVREVMPFAGFLPGEFSVVIAATTPASSAGDKVLWQADDNAVSGSPIGKNYVRIVWDTSGRVRLIAACQTSALVSVEQANLDLGSVAPNTAFRVAISAKADAFRGSLDGRPAMQDTSGLFPGIATIRIGGSQAAAHNWNGSISRATQFPVAKAADVLESLSAPSVRRLLVAWGDSLTAGAGATAGHNFPQAVSALLSPARAVANKGVGGETSTQIRTRFFAEAPLRLRTALIWAGRNNYNARSTVLADIAAMVAQIRHDRFLIGSVINGNYATEYLGQAGHSDILALNAELADRYGSRFVNLRGALIAAGDPVADATDLSHDIVPGSLRSDNIHLNDAGYAIAAATWVAALNAQGW